jgi:hypothetical protein
MMPPAPGYRPPPAPRVSGYAIASLVTGIVSLPTCCCGDGFWGTPLAIASLVAGILAVTRIRNEPQAYKGIALAVIGIVLGSVGLVECAFSIFTAVDERLREQYGP